MTEATATFGVRRSGTAAVVDIEGDVTAGSEAVHLFGEGACCRCAGV